MTWSRVSVLVCMRCGQDLVYVELRRGRLDGRLHLDRWPSGWFGCDCPGRERLVFADTFEIAEAGRGHGVRVERWGPAR